MQKQCEYIHEETGEECQGFALESGLCFSHDPNYKDEKMAAVTKGGLAPKKIKLNLTPISIKTTADVLLILEETINGVRSGQIPCSNPANTIGFLCSHVLKAIEISTLEVKLEAIDRIILERRVTERMERR